jgi:hypothetical protein
MMVYTRPFFLDVVLVFLRPGPSVCEKPQAVIGHTVAQHPKFDSPTVVVLLGQILHETGFVFGVYQAPTDTNFLVRGVGMPDYPVCMVHMGLVPCTGIAVWFSRAWQSFVVDKVQEAHKWGKQCLVNIFPNHVVAWEHAMDQYDAKVGFLMMPIFRIQVRNPFTFCVVILDQFFSRVVTLPALLLITCCAYMLDSVTMRVRIKSVKKRWK